MTKYTPRSDAKISVSVLVVLMCAFPLLLSCGIGKEPTQVEVEEPAPVEVEEPTPAEVEGTLWALTNPKRSFDAFLNPDRPEYHINDLLTLHLRVTENAHLIIFNWDDTGMLAILFPNAFQMNNFIKAGSTYRFPGADANFDIQLPGPVGTERFKVIALRNAADSSAIINFLPREDGVFQKVSGDQRLEIEKKILAYLREMDPTNWAEDTEAVLIQASAPRPEQPSMVVAPVIREMFFQPLPLQEDVVIDAGMLGRYRFSEDTEPPNVPTHIIRQELVDLLNTLQRGFKQPMLIKSGYRSPQHQIYLWAKWLSEHPDHIAELNRQNHPTWGAWVQASQTLTGCPSLESKHQTGEAVDFYWEMLDLSSVDRRESLTQQILETGGTRDYTLEERQRFGIPNDDNYLFTVTAHGGDEMRNTPARSGRTYFRVVYRPSTIPTMPNIEQIGMLLPASEPEKELWTLTNPRSGFTVSLKTDSTDYHPGDFLTLETQVTEDAYIIILNWDKTGRLAIMLPNTYQPDNFARADTPYFVPGTDADFDIRLPGPVGTERFKVIALRHNSDNREIINLFRTGDDPASQAFCVWERSEAEIVAKRVNDHLRQINREDWAEDSKTFEIRQPEPTDDPAPPTMVPLDYSIGDTVYIKDGSDMYFGKVTAEVVENDETVAIDIFNNELRQKLGDTVSKELIMGRRIEPTRGWGTQEVMLSFYRDGEWIFTTDVVVFEDYYKLPARIDGNPVRGSRDVSLAEVRFPIPVSFESDD